MLKTSSGCTAGWASSYAFCSRSGSPAARSCCSCPSPALSGAEARARAEPVPFGQVEIAPSVAFASVPDAVSLRLVGRLGQPVYVVGAPPGDRAISARTGRPVPQLTSAEARVIATRFSGSPAARVSEPIQYDQWIVHQGFDHARPMYRVALADHDGTQLYVSARTGEVVQKTRASERAWNWLGAVVHWLYFVPLRRVFSTWDQTVWWVSLGGLAMTGVGIGLGLYRTAKKMSSKRPAVSPLPRMAEVASHPGPLRRRDRLDLDLQRLALHGSRSPLLPGGGAHGPGCGLRRGSSGFSPGASRSPSSAGPQRCDLRQVQRGRAPARRRRRRRFNPQGPRRIGCTRAQGSRPPSWPRPSMQPIPVVRSFGPNLLAADDFYAKAEGVPSGTESYGPHRSLQGPGFRRSGDGRGPRGRQPKPGRLRLGLLRPAHPQLPGSARFARAAGVDRAAAPGFGLRPLRHQHRCRRSPAARHGGRVSPMPSDDLHAPRHAEQRLVLRRAPDEGAEEQLVAVGRPATLDHVGLRSGLSAEIAAH